MVIYSDASANPNLSWGVFVPRNGWWSYGKWDTQYITETYPSIDLLEMFAILVFLDMKGAELSESIIHFKSDNQPTVDTLTNKTSKSPHLMQLIRSIVLICLQHNIRFTILHVSGHLNIHADHLSCLQLHKFLSCIEDIENLQYWKLSLSLALIQQHIAKLIQAAPCPNMHSVYNRA